MGTIVQRRRKNGSIAYSAQIVIKSKGVIVHRETETFSRRPAAAAWIERRETELKAPGGLERAKSIGATLADAIDTYTADSLKAIGRTKAQVLKAIKTYDIADKACDEITSADIVALARELSRTVKPQTVSNYLAHLSALFAIAKPAWGFDLDRQAMRDAVAVAKRLGLTTKSRERDRRPTLGELDKLMTHFLDRQRRRPGSSPMHRIIPFAVFSTRRLDEISRILWTDFDRDGKRVLIRDMKNPGEKIGNNVWCDLPDEAVEIIEAMPRVADEIFPYNPGSIGAAFTRACQFLGIEDLHFHDLRHDGVSRLFEMGHSIPRVAAVSGHRSWQSLKRYTHLRQTGDKYAGWKWLPVATQASSAPTA